MKDFNRDRKSSGFGGSDRPQARSFGGRSFSRPTGGGSRFGGQSQGDRRSSGGGRERSFGANSYSRPEMHQAVCDECGSKCEVPFRPNGSRPILCSLCFAGQGERSNSFGSRTASRGDDGFRGDKKMFKAHCTNCGAACEVSFKPVEGRDVFCGDCFRGNKTVGKPETAPRDNYQEQLSRLEKKIDEIIGLLAKDLDKKEPIAKAKLVKVDEAESEAEPEAKPKKRAAKKA